MACNYVQVWRLRTAERCRFARQLSTTAQHLQVTAGCQLSGHVATNTDSIASSINIGRLLSVVVELGTVDRALQLAHSLKKVGHLMHREHSMYRAVCVRLALGYDDIILLCSQHACDMVHRLPSQDLRQVTCSKAT